MIGCVVVGVVLWNRCLRCVGVVVVMSDVLAL